LWLLLNFRHTTVGNEVTSWHPNSGLLGMMLGGLFRVVVDEEENWNEGKEKIIEVY
jgi:hypothetical protein